MDIYIHQNTSRGTWKIAIKKESVFILFIFIKINYVNNISNSCTVHLSNRRMFCFNSISPSVVNLQIWQIKANQIYWQSNPMRTL